MINAYNYAHKELISVDGDLFLTVDSLITINNIITNSSNYHLRSVDVKPVGYNKKYMDFTQIESELYLLINQFNDRFISKNTFLINFLEKYIHF